jgi:hypothetical protein
MLLLYAESLTIWSYIPIGIYIIYINGKRAHNGYSIIIIITNVITVGIAH